MNWPVINDKDTQMVEIDDKSYVNFTSNDYLGLSVDEQLKQGMINSIQTYGCGSTGSRRLSGNHQLFLDVEGLVSSWVGQPSGVFFNSGFQMNVAIFQTLATQSTLILADKLSHASLVDGIINSTAPWKRFRHNDMDHLNQLLSKYHTQYDQIFVVVESIYSMDGDQADLYGLVQLKLKYGFKLIVDEAHAIGVYGDQGRGLVSHQNLVSSVDIILLTFGKAFGLSGAALLSDEKTTAEIKLRCRSYIYSTALPLPNIAAIKTALNLVISANIQREQLYQNIDLFKSLVSTKSLTQIQPVIIGEKDKANQLEQYLMEHGIFSRAVHHPTVPYGESRLRITVLSHHTSTQIVECATKINAWLTNEQ